MKPEDRTIKRPVEKARLPAIAEKRAFTLNQ
jgi:hypothetical protein